MYRLGWLAIPLNKFLLRLVTSVNKSILINRRIVIFYYYCTSELDSN